MSLIIFSRHSLSKFLVPLNKSVRLNKKCGILDHWEKNLFFTRCMSTGQHNDEDFFSAFKKRIAEEAEKEKGDIQDFKKNEKVLKFKKTIKDSEENIIKIFNTTRDSVGKATREFTKKRQLLNETLGKYSIFKYFGNLDEKYDISTKFKLINDRIPKIQNRDNPVLKIFSHIYENSLGMYIKMTPRPFEEGKIFHLKYYTEQLEKSVPIVSDKTGIVALPRKGYDWFRNEYIPEISFINKFKFFCKHTENPVARFLVDGYLGFRKFTKSLFINKDSIEAYKNLTIVKPDFNKEIFIFNWENIIVPGILDAFLHHRDMEIIEKWTTPDCFEQIVAISTYLEDSKTFPIVVDIYDCDIVDMKLDPKTGTPSIIFRTNIIFNFKKLNMESAEKYVLGTGYKEVILNWELKTDPSNAYSDLAFKVADFGTTWSQLYGLV